MVQARLTNLLVAGATGLVGEQVLARALDDRRIDRVVAPTRRPLALHPKLVNPIIDFDHMPLQADWWAVDAVVCALGTTRAAAGSAQAFRHVDHDLVLSIAKRARAGGATRFALVSSMGANPASRFLYARTKGEIEEAVRRLEFPSLTIVRPGLLGGVRAQFRLVERIAQAALEIAAPVLPRRLRASPAGEVAKVLVEALVAGLPGLQIVESERLAGDGPAPQRA
jgi:uncharacterized protein YbjT (DUF2867 family)